MKTFTYTLHNRNSFIEYEIRYMGEIFCHLSETDFFIFQSLNGVSLKEVK